MATTVSEAKQSLVDAMISAAAASLAAAYGYLASGKASKIALARAMAKARGKGERLPKDAEKAIRKEMAAVASEMLRAAALAKRKPDVEPDWLALFLFAWMKRNKIWQKVKSRAIYPTANAEEAKRKARAIADAISKPIPSAVPDGAVRVAPGIPTRSADEKGGGDGEIPPKGMPPAGGYPKPKGSSKRGRCAPSSGYTTARSG